MNLKPEVSLGVGLATAAVVGGVYVNALPTLAEVRISKPQDQDLEAARKVAAWTSAAIVGGISLLAKDPTVFIVGGAMVIITDWWYRHANVVNPMWGKATVGAALGSAGPVTEQAAPDDFGYTDDMVSVG